MAPAFFFLLLALALIGTELLIMQLSVFWFLFIGLGALIASLAAWLIPEMSWSVATGIFIVSSVLVSAVLYPFLKKWQDQPAVIPGNDAIGQKVKVIAAISTDKDGRVSWSGTDWSAQLAEGEAAFELGESAIIRRLTGIHLIVGR
jgi:membrane protein implicated in regulation of membrane protease activity